MARVRKLFLTIASGSALYSGLVPAVGLGEITINSSLNQPLAAEIELLEVGDLSESDMHIGLAPVAVFDRAGVDRSPFLDDLRFTALLRGGKSVIRVESRKPVREPYLNFVVELARPSGRLLREYTLLIDPQDSLPNRPQAAGFQRSISSLPTAPGMQLPQLVAPPSASLGNTYQVVRGDSLWKIAKRLQSAGSQVALPELMAGIHALNPQAFVGGNINRLVAGAVLLLPDRADPTAAAPFSSQASADMGASLPAQAETPAPPPAPEALHAVADVQRQLDEVLASQDLQRTQLQQQMNDLQGQLAILREQVASKDQQVATLQTQLQQQPQADSVSENTSHTLAPVAAGEGVSGWLAGLLSGFAGAGLLTAIIGGLFWWRRRESPELEPERMFSDYRQFKPPASRLAVRSRVLAPGVPVLDSPKAPDDTARLHSVEKTSAVVAEPDALDGANIYMAYGRLDEARGVLLHCLEKEPGRNDARLCLLELLAKTGDREAFVRHEALLLAHGGSQADIERIRVSHPDFTEPQLEADPLGEVVLDLSEPAVSGHGEDATNTATLNLDDLELDVDWGLPDPESKAGPATNGADDAINGSFDLSENRDSPAGQGAQVYSPFTSIQSKIRPGNELLSSKSTDSDESKSLEHLAGDPQSISRLNMALAYIDQGDLQSACNILNQLISEGDDKQKKQAREILSRIA